MFTKQRFLRCLQQWFVYKSGHKCFNRSGHALFANQVIITDDN